MDWQPEPTPWDLHERHRATDVLMAVGVTYAIDNFPPGSPREVRFVYFDADEAELGRITATWDDRGRVEWVQVDDGEEVDRGALTMDEARALVDGFKAERKIEDGYLGDDDEE